MNDLKLKAKAADAIAELHAFLVTIRDCRQFPPLLEPIIHKLFPIDWLAMFSFGQGAKSYGIVTNPSLPFDWNEKYIFPFTAENKQMPDYLSPLIVNITRTMMH